jgi:hypothetical protein
VAMLESGRIYIDLEEGKAEGVGQSGTRNVGEKFRSDRQSSSTYKHVSPKSWHLSRAPKPSRTTSLSLSP